MRILPALVLAGTLAGTLAGASASAAGAAEQAACGPRRCFARPFWRYRSGAGFLPYRRFGFRPPPPRFAPLGFGRPFGGFRRF